ncbi:MAG TPA: ArsA-related P-loop ATPase [Candidatus Binataceae bacterium]
MKDLLKKGSILILLGTGGVGKTTVAAALGVASAASGLDTAVITVDPARRLRDALGLERLGGEPARLDARVLKAAGLSPSLPLAAMMLDVKGAWDAMIERFAIDPAARKRIFENPFYRSLSAEFAGSDAFAALQQLYDLHQSGRFDLEIVDTPPAAHAFEFLEAPARYMRLLDSRAARWLFTPSLAAGRLAAKLASGAARFVVRELERFAGVRMLSTIAEFFAAAAEAVDAILDRLRKTHALLHSPAVRFVLVTTAEVDRLRRARELIDEMERDGLKLAAIVINRFLDERMWGMASVGTLKYLEDIPRLRAAVASEIDKRRGVVNLVAFFEEHRARALGDIERIARFARELPAGVRLAIAPEIGLGVRDLAAVARVGDYLVGGVAALRPLEAAASRLIRRAHHGTRARAKPE